MEKNVCGGCNLQGDSKSSIECPHIFCLYDRKWHPEAHSCEHWQQYSSNISKDNRLKIASDLLNCEREERRHKEMLVSAKLDRKTQILISVISFFGGIFATLLTQWIISKCIK